MKNARVIIPHSDNKGNSLEGVIKETALSLCSEFGGATRINAEGLWVNPQGKLYAEPVAILEAAMNPNEANKKALQSIAKELLQITDQEAVYIQYADGQVEIIGGQ